MALLVSASTLRSALKVGASVADADLSQVSGAAEAAVRRYITTEDALGAPLDFTSSPDVLEAVLAVAVDFFQARTAPGGQSQGVDFQPSPRLSAYIVQRAVQTYCFDRMDTGAWFA